LEVEQDRDERRACPEASSDFRSLHFPSNSLSRAQLKPIAVQEQQERAKHDREREGKQRVRGLEEKGKRRRGESYASGCEMRRKGWGWRGKRSWRRYGGRIKRERDVMCR